MLPWSISSVPNRVVGMFTVDYVSSQLMANWIAYYYSQGNRRYFFGWQLGPLIGLSLITAVRLYKQTSGPTITNSSTTTSSSSSSSATQQKDSTDSSITENTAEFLFKTIPLGVLLSICSQSTINDMLELSGIAKPIENTYALYRDLIIHWGLQAKVNFVTSLSACNPDYERMEWSELWGFIKNLVVKPYCLYGVVIMARFFRKWRKSTEPKEPNSEIIERAKNYILEDFLEEHHVSMSDMTKKETEAMFNEYMELFAKCNYDYDRYKKEKLKMKKEDPNEHLEFMNDIKKLKEQINEIREQKDKKQTKDKENEKTTEDKEIKEEKINEDELAEEEGEKEEHNDSSTATNKTKPSLNGKKSFNSKTSQTKSSSQSNKSNSNSGDNDDIDLDDDDNTCNYRSFHYLYSFLQMAVFAFIGLSVRKLFFLCFTQGCVLGSTICSLFMSRKNRRIFWTAYLSVFLTSIINPGIRVSYIFYISISYNSDHIPKSKNFS